MDADNDNQRPRERQGFSLLVRNLRYETSPDRVRKHFEAFGEVRDVYLPLDYFTRKPRGFGFIEFLDEEAAMGALKEVDGTTLDGTRISVAVAKQGRRSPDSMRKREREQKHYDVTDPEATTVVVEAIDEMTEDETGSIHGITTTDATMIETVPVHGIDLETRIVLATRLVTALKSAIALETDLGIALEIAVGAMKGRIAMKAMSAAPTIVDPTIAPPGVPDLAAEERV